LSNHESSAPVAKGVAAETAEIALRIAILFLLVTLFLPGLNPARISEKINRNMSLFTSGVLYGSLTADMGRLIAKGWVRSGTMQLLYAASLLSCLGMFAAGAGAAMTMGNARFKRLAHIMAMFGSAAVLVGLFGIRLAHAQLLTMSDLAKSKPVEPFALTLTAIVAAAVFGLAILSLIAVPAPKKGEAYAMDTRMQLFLLLLPFVLLVFLFNYLPLWGWRYAFFDYKVGDALTADRFVGFKWFSYLFQNEATKRDVVRVLVNTLAMSGLGILTSWFPMAFAIFLAEIRSMRLRRFIQTLTTVPNFISWVLVYAVAFCIFSTDGFLSSVMVNAGVWSQGKNLLMGESHIWLKMLGWGVWKGLGWSAIMYIAAISAIDPQLYEAATVDGAGRFGKMWHITLPELIPTYMVLLLLSIAGILNNGMEQYLVFENATNTDPITVLDLYVYKLGIGKGSIPLSTLIGMVKSLVSVALLFGANAISKAVRGSTIV